MRDNLQQRWKAMPSSTRTFLTIAAAFVVIVLLMAVIGYWDAPQMPSPSGEGG